MEAAPPLALAYWCRCPRGCNRAGNGDCCYCDLCYHDGTWCKCNCEGCRAPAPPSFTVQESWDAYGEEDCDGVVLDRRAMDSAVAGRCGASQPAADRSPTLGTSRSASGARLVQHPLERRQARDGGWYTMQEFKQYYRSFSAWRWHWDTAVLPVVPPSVLLSAVASIPRIASAAAAKPEVLIQPNCMRCDWLGSGVELDSELRVVRREPVCRACNAIAPPSRIYVYDELF